MLYRKIQENKRKTFFLVVIFCIIVLLIGWAIGYLVNGDVYSGIIITTIILIFYIPITYMSAGSQVLSMSGAREIKREDHPQLFSIVDELTITALLPMTKVYIINDPAQIGRASCRERE